MTVLARVPIVVLALAALAAGAFLLARLATPEPSDEERIRALLADTARAVQEQRVGDAMEAISPRFRGRGMDRDGLKGFVTFQALRGEWNRVAIAGDLVEVAGDAATATVHVLVARSGRGEALSDLLPVAGSAWRIACTLAREEEGWRVVTADWRSIPLDAALAAPPAEAVR